MAKVCTKCGLAKPLEEFYRGRYKCGYRAACKDCANKASVDWARANPEKVKQIAQTFKAQNPEAAWQHYRTWRLKAYGLTPREYDQKLIHQKGLCKVCGGQNRDGRMLAVDHDHRTGRVRDLLCSPCNTALGLLQEDANTILALARYIAEWKK